MDFKKNARLCNEWKGVFACRAKILVRVTVVGIPGDLFPNKIKKRKKREKVMEKQLVESYEKNDLTNKLSHTK